MNCPCPTANSQAKQPTLLESAGEVVLLVVVLAVIAIVPLLVCEWLACIALPVPANGTPEARQAVAAQRESLDLPGAFEMNTWDFGLQRMLLGYAVGAGDAWAGIEPLESA